MLWLDHAGAATTSEVCMFAPTSSDLVAVSTDELGLTLPTLPWHSMAATRVKYCSLPAHRHPLRCVFDPSSSEDLFLPQQGMCALVLRDVSK